MKTRYWPLALVIGLGLGALVAAPAADPPMRVGDAPKVNTEQIAKLVKQLGSDDFDEREKATKELEAIGAPALDALREAAKDGEAEVKTRAAALIRKVESKNANEKLLAPTKVKLTFKDTPLTEAIAEFNKKSGYTIQLLDPEKKLKDRTVTLDTGEVTFWEAFDKFCEKAGLVDATLQDLLPKAIPGGPGGLVPPNPFPVRPLPPEKAPPKEKEPPARTAPPVEKKEDKKEEKKDDGDKPEAPRAQVQRVVPPGGAAPPPGGGFGGPVIVLPAPGFGPLGMGSDVIMVVDGKPKTVPTCYSGAVRIRALKENPNGLGFPFPPIPLPPGGAPGAAPVKEDATTVWLEVRAEPKLQLQMLQSVALDKAIDDQDQKLEQAKPVAPVFPGVVPGGFGGGGVLPVPPGGAPPAIARPPIAIGGFGGFGGFGGGIGFGGVQTYPLQLKKGEKEAKALKELAGKITAQALSAAEPLITADKIAKASGETFKGKDGGRIKVTDVKEEEGKIIVKFELEQPAGVIPAGGLGGFGGGFGVPIGPPGRLVPPPPKPEPAAPPPAPPGGAGFAVPAPQVQVQVQIGPGGGGGFAPPGGGIAGFRGFGSAPGITLVDDKGKTIAQSGGGPPKVEFGGLGKAPVIEWTQEYKLEKDQKPAKLVFSASKMVNIDIPFSFKDVPLK